MPITTFEEKTYLVIDNCVLSMLTDCFCDGHKRLSGIQLLHETQQSILDLLNIMKSFAVDGSLHTTQVVSLEYQPQNGILGNHILDRRHIKTMAMQVRRQFELLGTSPNSIQYLRELPKAPRHLIHPTDGLSDADMSLIHLGLHLTQNGNKVFLLSNDQDLLQFSSWIRIQKCLRNPPMNPVNLEGMLCLAYLDLLHRNCDISTKQMSQFINYLIRDTGNRMAEREKVSLNPKKGAQILDQIAAINQVFAKSIEDKLNKQGVLA